MSKRDRPTLKKFFRDGALPTSEHYGDLVDSMVNRIDDGFDKTDREGLRIASLGSSPMLMSFYNGAGAAEPVWTIGHGRSRGHAALRPATARRSTSRVPGPTARSRGSPWRAAAGSG